MKDLFASIVIKLLLPYILLVCCAKQNLAAQSNDSFLLSLTIPVSLSSFEGSKERVFGPYWTYVPTLELSARYFSKFAVSPEVTTYLETRTARSVWGLAYFLHTLTFELLGNVSVQRIYQQLYDKPLFTKKENGVTPIWDVGIGAFASYIYKGKEERFPIDHPNFNRWNYGVSAQSEFMLLLKKKPHRPRTSVGLGLTYHYGIPKILDFRLSSFYINWIKINVLLP